MRSSVAVESVETPRQSLPRPSGAHAKATASTKEPERFFREVARDVMQRRKQLACAAEIGISEGRLSAKLSDGSFNFGEVEKLGVGFALELAEEIQRRYGSLMSPEQKALDLIDSAIKALLEVRQFIAFKA